MFIILNLVYLVVFILILPKMLFRMLTQNRYKRGWANRFGNITRSSSKKSIWIHAVSVGEVNATSTIIKTLKSEMPQYDIVITTTTDTGYDRANAVYKDICDICFFPMDFTFVMKKAFKKINPVACVLMELEVWPNFSTIANKNMIPVIVANGRLSPRSFPRYKSIKKITKWMFNKVDLFLLQSQEYYDRFIALGTSPEKLVITSSLKYDTAQTDTDIPEKTMIASQLLIEDQSLIVAGGTGPDEEKIILEAFLNLKNNNTQEKLRLAIVPRKPERFNLVADMILSQGLKLTRFSEYKDSDKSLGSPDKDSIILCDTMGDLRKFYALSDFVFVGRSLTPMGGSDMMESTAMGKFTCFGPYTFNFTQTVDELLKADGAVEIKDSNLLFEVLNKAINDRDYAHKIASNGQKVIVENQGATRKTVDYIKLLINEK